MLYNTTYDVYQIITSPDIDISKFSDIIVQSIQQAKKMIPRANKAFKKIEESVELLKNNFQNYYKDFITTKNPTIIVENFILDVSKENTGELDLDLARQFKKIVMFYQKKSQGKIKDPRINQLFEMLNKNFDMLNVKDKDVSESEESDIESDIEIVKNVDDKEIKPAIAADPIIEYMTAPQLEKAIAQTQKSMEKAAKELDFLSAAKYRDELFAMKEKLAKKV